MTVEVKEAFHQIIKMAILFGGMAIFYIWIESKLLHKWKKEASKAREIKLKNSFY